MARDKIDKTPVATPATSATQKKQAAQETWSKVYWAYQNANPPSLLPGHSARIGVFAAKWIETRNTSFMDAAIDYCHRRKLPVLPELLEHVHAAMTMRINDGNSPKKAFAYFARELVFEEMAKLTYHGATLQRAAELGAYISHSLTEHPMKASTLEKEFPKHRDRFTDFLRLLFEDPHTTESERAETRRQYETSINQKIVIPDHIMGERR